MSKVPDTPSIFSTVIAIFFCIKYYTMQAGNTSDPQHHAFCLHSVLLSRLPEFLKSRIPSILPEILKSRAPEIHTFPASRFCQLPFYFTSIIISNSSTVTFSCWNNAMCSLSSSSGRSHHLSSSSLEILHSSFSFTTLAGVPAITTLLFICASMFSNQATTA